MGLTKTQKEFRKQMGEINSNPSKYENSRYGNPFYKQRGSGLLWLLLIIAIPVLVLTKIPGGKSTQGAMSPSKADFLQQLNISSYSVNNSLNTISGFHQQSWAERDNNTYQAALIDAITVCDKSLADLNEIKPIKTFAPLHSITKEHVTYSRNALKAYLDATYSRNKSDIDLGNKYLQLANQSSQSFRLKFIEILEQNGYKYEILENGEIRFWYIKTS